MSKTSDLHRAVFAAGCFWGVEAGFRQVKGVVATAVGYTGGATPNPTYEQVCTGKTGHVEAVEMLFDPSVVSYSELLDIFWGMHDPTLLNKQGPDVGTQYRSAIFYQDNIQMLEAKRSIKQLEESGRYSSPVVTELSPSSPFYRAEEYHQQYYERNDTGGVCHVA